MVIPTPLQVSAGGDSARSAVITRFDGMAARALKEQIPGMLVRQTLRAAAKYGAQKKAKLDSRDGVLGTKEHATGREVAQVGSENRTEL